MRGYVVVERRGAAGKVMHDPGRRLTPVGRGAPLLVYPAPVGECALDVVVAHRGGVVFRSVHSSTVLRTRTPPSVGRRGLVRLCARTGPAVGPAERTP